MDILFAQSSTGTATTLASFLPFILMFVIFYVIVIRPQSNQRKKHEDELKSLKQGDRILTRGGVYGVITNFQGKEKEMVTIEVSTGTQFNVDRNYIVGKVNKK